MVKPSALSSRAASRRAGERGATVFVVVMAITMLTAVGIFAAHSATLADEAAGYNRLARQTQQLAEYGTVLATAELSAGGAQDYLDRMDSLAQTCVSNQGRTAPCYRFDYEILNEKVKAQASESLTKDPTGTIESVISSGGVRADFAVELTDHSDPAMLIPGMDYSSPNAGKYASVVATTYAQVRPVGAAACSDTSLTVSGTGNASATGAQSMRAHLIIGPVFR